MASKLRRQLIAVCQLTSTHDKEENFKMCERLIGRASAHTALMAFLPEGFDYIGRSREEAVELAHSEDGEYISRFRALAKSFNMWLSLGGFHELNPSDSSKVLNTHLILNNHGETVAKYHKLHLFDVEIPGKVKVKESDFTTPGKRLFPPVDTPFGRIGLATCYDLRFPELSCWLRENGCDLITYPSAFTLNTGMAHWEVLLRARAIENQCYVMGSAQTGKHNDKRVSYGHAMIVDPWGAVVAECSEGAGICLAEIDLDYVLMVRNQLPCSQHKRQDLYQLATQPAGSANVQVMNGPKEYAFGDARIHSSIVFYRTALSFAFVNRKPVLPGHVLVVSLRPVCRITDLGPAEIADLFSCVQKVVRCLETHFGVTSTTATVQNGPDAGQTVPHVHVHVLPRKPGDFKENDDIYSQLEKHDKVPDESKFRTMEDMQKEAKTFREIMNTL